jgi:carbon-monoxide dehydrogenase medium subunit
VQITKEGGSCVAASIAMTNLSDTPVFSEDAGNALVGTSVDKAALDAAVTAMLGDIDPTEDNRGPVAFKNHVAGVILRRAIERAWSRA